MLYLLQLGGVSCNGCVNKIRKQLQPLDPDLALEVDLKTKQARVDTQLPIDAVLEQIIELGYQVELLADTTDAQPASSSTCCSKSKSQQSEEASSSCDPSQRSTSPTSPKCDSVNAKLSSSVESETSPVTRLSLTQITCAGCVKTVDAALHSVAGVDSVEINFANRSAQVVGAVEVQQLINAVEQAGYGAVEIVDPAQAELQRERDRLQELALKRRAVWLALGLGVPMMLYGMVEGMAVDTPIRQLGWGMVGLLTLVVMVLAGGHFFSGALKSARNHSANMDTLIALGTGSAWAYSMLVVIWPELLPAQSRGLYFEASAMIIGLVNLGQVLELRARGQTQQAIRGLLDLQPKMARVVRDGQELDVAVEMVQSGELLRLRPGETVAVDGEVEQGSGLVDEAMLTGESLPVSKQVGDSVSAGTLNSQGSLLYRATRVGRDTALAKIIELVQQAQNSKPPISQLADRVAAIFVPCVLLIAGITALAWWQWGPAPQSVYMLVTAVTVLIIACPCALGLATPISTMIGIGKAAEQGVLIRNGDALQQASGLTTLVMDKTGTLTQGRPEVVDLELVAGVDRVELLSQLLAVEQRSQHPLATALATYSAEFSSPAQIDEFHSHDGLGLTAKTGQQVLAVGNPRLMAQQKVDIRSFQQQAQAWEAQARTVIYIARDQQLAAIVAIADPIRNEAKAAVHRLHRLGVRLVMLTGDNAATAQSVAAQLGIDQFRADLLPADKLDAIKQLQAEGERVGMVGDGINDAPALSQADVGFAIGSGTDVAIESADVALMHDSLHGLADAIELSRATLRNIKQNLWGAFIYNSIGIPVAAGVLFPLTGLLLNPVIAGLAMSLSSVTVVSNANRLRWVRTTAQRKL